MVKCLPAYVRLTEQRDKTPRGVSGSKQVTVITMLLLPWLHCGVVCMAAQRAPLARIQYVPYILLFATRKLSAVTASECISYLKTTVTEHIRADEVVSVTLEGDCTAHMSAYTGESSLCVCTNFCWVCILFSDIEPSSRAYKWSTHLIHRYSNICLPSLSFICMGACCSSSLHPWAQNIKTHFGASCKRMSCVAA